MKNNTTAAVIAPFTAKPNVTLTAPRSAREMNEDLNLGINLNSGAISLKKRDALMAAALKLVGGRKPSEPAESWAARAQEALNARFSTLILWEGGNHCDHCGRCVDAYPDEETASA